MKRTIRYSIALILKLLLFSSVAHAGVTPDTEMQFYGTLVADPCTVAPEDTDITLEFDEIIDKYLYLNTRTHSRPFTIHLIDCDVEGSETVTTHFGGVESATLPGYLAMTDTSTGAAVGITEADDTFLGLNKDSRPIVLSDGSISLNFKAFIEGEPAAIKNETIKLGEFSATATFYLEYQ